MSPWRAGLRWGTALSALGLAGLFVVQVVGRARLDAPAPTPILYDRHSAFLAQIGDQTVAPDNGRRIGYGYWTVAAPPDRVVRATLALEDRRFWSHPGVDPIAVVRAVWQDLNGGHRRSGASTVAMQVARMQHPSPRTLCAKAVETATAPPPRRPDAVQAILRIAGMLTQEGTSAADPRIRTSLDLDVQRATAALAGQQVRMWSAAGAQQVGVLMLRRQSREVLAMVGSAGYGTVPGGAIDFTRASRSPGSTLKPFIFALALHQGRLTPADVMDDLPEGAAGISNADRNFLGLLLPRQALANSRNVPAANLLGTLGLGSGFEFFRDLGLHRLDAPAESFGLSMAIGSLPTSLDRLVRAYGVLADQGMLRDLIWYAGQPTHSPRHLLTAETARQVTLFLSDPFARLPSFPRYGTTEYPFPVALKTGTSQGYRDTWIAA
jgi:membrane carboxypeptidase/penicillin-binding protein PbpC